MTVQSPPPPAAAPQPPKKGMGPLAWIGIGCGVIIVIGCIVMAAGAWFVKSKVDSYKKNPALSTARLIVAANPDLDVVSEDDNAQTLTVHNKKTNETVTMNLDDIKNGKFKFSSEGKGAASVDFSQGGVSVKARDEKGQESTFVAGGGAPKDLPAWLPTYPGAAVEGGISNRSAQATAQTFTLTTTDPVDRVLAFYQDQLKNNGLAVQQPTTMATGGQTTTGTLAADSGDKKRHVQVVAQAVSGKTQATVSYEEKQ